MAEQSMWDFTVTGSGRSRQATLDALEHAGVGLNAHAELLLAHAAFDVPEHRTLTLTSRTVADLGFADGATHAAIFDAAAHRNLRLVPITAAPDIRLATVAQADAPDSVLSAGRVPTGAVQIASAALGDEEYPRGFYLRTVDGQSWLRGYRCDDDYVMNPEAVFLFRSES